MSTPQTLPPHHPNYGYSHHQNYQSTSGYRNNNNLVTTGSRLGTYTVPTTSSNGTTTTLVETPRTHPHDTHTSKSTQRAAGASAASPSMSTTVAKKRQRSREREPDWDNFYKNGLTKEIIVIDDSPEPSAAAVPQHNGRSENRGENGHAAKKRRRDDVGTAYDPVYHLDRSNEHTPGYNSASKSTISTDRTTSAIHTTASIMARCSRLSCVWNSASPVKNSTKMHPILQISQGYDHPS